MRFMLRHRLESLSLFLVLCLLVAGCTPPQRKTGRASRARTSQGIEQGCSENEGPQSASSRNSSTKRVIYAPPAPSRQRGELSAKELYAKCNPAVFTIRTLSAQGSGFFIKDNGLAVTNYHVLMGASSATIRMADHREYQLSEILSSSEDQDYAIFKVGVNGRVPFLHIFKGKPEVGEKVYAIGSPQGLENTFSSGLVSQLRDEYEIQIDVSIDHGSSGGALLNAYGEVIGITSAGMSSSSAKLNFAISTELIRLQLGWR